MRSKAQVTIFIIIGVVLIGVIGLFFLSKAGVIPKISGGGEINTKSFLESCIEDKVMEATQLISSQGGYISNQLNRTFQFEGENLGDISYLCYTHNYYTPCINQEPMLIQHLKEDLKNYISNEVKNCFDELAASSEKRGYAVEARYNGFDVGLNEKKIIIDINGEMKLTKTEETSKQDEFKIIISSRFYDLGVVAQEIVSQEAEYCNFEQLGFVLFYPRFKIDKFRTGDSTTFYTLQHKETKEKFRFAVKSCVMPPGI